MSKNKYSVKNLKTDNLVNPIGIDSKNPVFSWNVANTEKRAVMQTAYRIYVAESEKNLDDGILVWDSGVCNSEETAYISYNGEELRASSRYFWKVSSFDNYGSEAVSDVAFFETGLMDEGWSDAKWIAKTNLLADGYFRNRIFTVDYDFKIVRNTASFVFGCSGEGDFLLWQISNNSNIGPGTYFRPQSRVSGGWVMSKDFEISDGKKWGIEEFVHMTIDVNNGCVKTYFDGELFNTLELESFELGYIGFRKPYNEEMIFDNIVIKDEDGSVIYSEDFSGETADGFKDLPVKNGVADMTGGAVNLYIRYGDSPEESSPMLRKEFSVPCGKTVKKANLYMTAAGIYKAYINGNAVSDSRLNPGMTAYDDHMLYQTFDITELVKNGENAIGVYLGHGWWNRCLRGFGSRLHIYGKILVQYTDGTSDIIVTDESWKFFRFGPILDDDLFNGFKFDGIIEESLDGWNKPGFDDSSWENVMVSPPDVIVANRQIPQIIAQNIPLIRNTVTLEPKEVTEPEKGVYVYDFGQNIAGVVRIKATAPRGTTVKLRHAEVINKEGMEGCDGKPGTIFTKNLPRAKATDTYVFKGYSEGEVFEPFFTYHGFRYLEITGIDAPIPVEDVRALLVMTDLEQESTFECSNPLVNRLYLNSLWSARDNFLSVPTDCPNRGERFGWTGDAQIFCRTGSYMMDVNAFYQKYCMDIRDTSENYRIIADVAPASCGAGWYGQGERQGATNGFGDAIAIVPYQIYKQYGNKAILEENYEIMCNWMDYLLETSHDFIRDESWTGDWMCVNDKKSPVALTDTAYCAYTASIISEIAEILGKDQDKTKYKDIYNSYRKAWRENFLEDDGYTTKCGTQTSYVLGLKFGLFDEDKKALATENLAKDIEKWDNHLTTGFLGYSFLNPILSDNGRSDVAYRLLEQTSYPSSLYSVTMGATTIWESWYVIKDKGDGRVEINDESHNHFSYGSVSEWLFRYMLGIERDDKNSNSFKHFFLKPCIGGTVTCAKGSYNSIRGMIESAWSMENGSLKYTAAIPANTTATLYLPVTDENAGVTESGVSAKSSEGVTFKGYENGCAVFELASGSYSFETLK